MNRFPLRHAFGTCLLMWAAHAQATLVDFQGFANGSRSVNFALSAPNASLSGFAQAGGFTALVDNSQLVTTYCVDLYESLSFSDPVYTNYTWVDGSAHAFKNTRADTDIGKLFAAGHAVNTATAQAAFQIAVWELAYENDSVYAVGSGSARFFGGSSADPGGALSLADAWLQQLSSLSRVADIQVLESVTQGNLPGRQDQVFVNRVPEPSTLALTAAALLGVGCINRRRWS